ncbi:MAG: hypothetical protein HQM08_28720 [Candidatus Riflebacteria bacterium]|nr:hypothetical protein [Candidatus Riflebacteria bacterium]
MSRYFNTTGPCNPEKHYMLPPSNRLIGAQLSRFIKTSSTGYLPIPISSFIRLVSRFRSA